MLSEFALTGSMVGVSIIVLILLVVGIILFMRRRLGAKSNLKEKYEGHTFESPLQARVKYPDVDGVKYSNSVF